MKSTFEFQLSNPFATERISPSKVTYRFSHGVSGANPQTVDAHLEGLLSRLRSSRKGMILGPHGTGKSTLLHTFLPKLQRSFRTVAFHHVNNDPTIGLRKRMVERMRAGKRIRHELQNLPADGLLVVDGWEQLTTLSRWRIARAAARRKLTLLVTAHHRIPGWTVVHETRSDPKLIRSLAGDLLNDSPFELRKLIETHLKTRSLPPSTNVRDLWFEMYDLVEDSKQTAQC